jgi:glutathione peroxidase-family protein
LKQSEDNIEWNFGKFLLNGNGTVISYFKPDQEPLEMIPEIEKLLTSYE